MPKRFRDEFVGAELGDARRSERLAELGMALAAFPGASLPYALGDGAALEAAYRFLGNDAIEPNAILEPHRRETGKRCEHRGTVIVAHDTTDFSYRGERAGLGRLRGRLERGFLAQTALAVSWDEWREPLGVLHLETWTRTAKKRKRIARKAAADPTLESRRWRRGVDAVEAHLGRGKAVHVMDREADAYDLLADLVGGGQRFIIRSCVDRLLADGDHISEALAGERIMVEREVTLSERRRSPFPGGRRLHPPRDTRTAILGIKASTIVIKRPTTQRRELPPSIRVNIVLVEEINPPRGEKPVEWRLFTTEKIDTPRAVERIVDGYRARWRIEEYFKALKTGCAIEKRQLGTYGALVNVLCVFVPIAWRILRHRTLAHAGGDLPASRVLTPRQLQILRRVSRRPLPRYPTVAETFAAIAGLGGHLARNGPPGWITLARGYERLLALEEGVELASEM